MSKHTPEPWQQATMSWSTGNRRGGMIESVNAESGTYNIGDDGQPILTPGPGERICWTESTTARENANAQRIVSCVNALAGIEHPQEFREAVEALIAFIEPFARGTQDGPEILQRISAAKGTP